MILTCPECATRFSTTAEAIGPNGRTVRCSQCSATWFASPDPDIISLNEIQNAPNVLESAKSTLDQEAIPDDRQPRDDENLDDFSEPEPHTVIRDKAEKKKVRRRLFGVSIIWIVTVLILLGLALITWLYRSQIVEKFPGTAGLYNALGVEASASGLEIFGVETRHGENEGIPVLFVTGSIKNYDVKTRDVPLINMSFKNSNGQVLTSWVIEPPKATLSQGTTLNFSSQYPNPPIDAKTLLPSFVDEMTIESVNSVPMASQ